MGFGLLRECKCVIEQSRGGMRSFISGLRAGRCPGCRVASQKVTFEFRQYRIILSADTASEVRQMLSQKRR